MKYSAASFAVVATVAACVGIFVALIVYVTLVAAVIFLFVAAAIALVLKLRKRS